MRVTLLHPIATLQLGAAIALAALPATRAQILPAEFATRRDSLAARIGDGVVVAFGGRTPVTDFGPFYQLPAFHYLTGFDEPDAGFVLVVRGGHGTGTLFLTPIAPRRALYYGRRPDSTAVARETGLAARSFPLLAPMVDSLVAAGLPLYTVADFADADFAESDSLTRGREFAKALVEKPSHSRLARTGSAVIVVGESLCIASPHAIRRVQVRHVLPDLVRQNG